MATGDVRGGSRAARDDNARHDAARCASSRRPRRPVPSRHAAIAPSGDSHDDRDAAAGAGMVVGGCGVRVSTVDVLIVLGSIKEYFTLIGTMLFVLEKKKLHLPYKTVHLIKFRLPLSSVGSQKELFKAPSIFSTHLECPRSRYFAD